jgi:hypothetical protein
MEFIWQYGGCGMSTGRLKQITYIGIIVLSITMWWSIFTNGFFITMFWLLVPTCIIGLILRYKERNRNV